MDIETLNERIRAFQESRAVLTGVELDIWSAVGDGATAAEVAAKVGTNPRSTGMLLNALVACELLSKTNGVYRATPVAKQHLTGAGRMATMHAANLWHTWSSLTDAVRAGTSVYEPQGGRGGADWTESFIAAMHRNASDRAPGVVRAIGVQGVTTVLDIGGGSGAYSIAFAQADPAITSDILDIEAVTHIAQRHIDEAGMRGRVRTIVGDLRTDKLGQNYDLVFLSAICHMLSEDENRDLLRRCFEACAAGGRVVIQDFILNADKTQPKFAALFALNMLVGTAAGNSYSEPEYSAWLRQAGFAKVRHVPLPGLTALMIGYRAE